jgi:outer membrane receptor protein involved in Fe transport
MSIRVATVRAPLSPRAAGGAMAVLSACALLAPSAFADDNPPAPNPVPPAHPVQVQPLQMAPVVVIGTTPLQSIGQPLANVPANVQIGTAKQISQQQSLNLGEFLDNNLGSVNSSNSVGNPYQMDVSYRGFTASPVLGTAIGLSVFLDGVRINEAFGDIVNWDLVPTNAIAGINLIPGSNPLFGLNTLGGAIVVNTKNGADYPGLKATAYAGSWGRRAVEAEYGGADDAHGVDYYLATNFFHEDGYRDWSRSDVNQIFTKERWHDEKSTLEMSLSLADNTMYGPSVLPLSMLHNPTYAYTAPDFDTNRNTLIELKGSRFITDRELLEGNVYYRVSNITGGNSNASCDDSVSTPENCVARQGAGDLDASNVISTTDQRGIGASAQLSLLGDLAGHKNKLTFGGSIDSSKVEYDSANYGANLVGEVTTTIDPSGANAINATGSNPYFQGSTGLTTRSNYLGLFATDNFAFDAHWNLTLSGRYNHATVDLEGASVDGGGNPIGSLNGNHAYHRFNPAIGLNFNPVKDLGFYASYSEGMRVPSPIELSCANPVIPCALPTGFTSDPNLDMIVSKTWEVGARGSVSRDLGWDLAAYDTGNQNDIQFIANGADNGVTGFFQNVGKTERKGIEIGLHGKFSRIAWAANYGFVDATYQSAFTEASPENSTADANGNITVNKGDRIPGIARQTLKLRASYESPAGWDVGTSVIAASGQYAHGDENNQDRNGMLGGYAVVNLDTHYRISSNWQVFAKVTNLLQKDYHTFGILSQNMFTAENELAVVPAVPRGVWVGVTYEFGGGNPAAADVD